jgi:hypothetical protein
MYSFTRTIYSEYVECSNASRAPSEDDTIKGVKIDEVVMFILSLVIPSFVKRNMKLTETFNTYETFYE